MDPKLRHTLVTLLGIAFVVSGSLFIAGIGHEPIIALGVPGWTIPLIGAIKVASALAMIVPTTRFYGAMGLAGTMAGAVLTHLVNADFAGAPPSLVLGTLAGIVAWTHRPAWTKQCLRRSTTAA